MIGFSHLALGGALAAMAAGVGGFFYGVDVGVDRERASFARQERAANKVRVEMQGRIDAAAEGDQARETARQGGVREIYRETQKIVERPVYSARCVDADGVRFLERAAANANGARVGASAGDAGGAPPPADDGAGRAGGAPVPLLPAGAL